MKPRNAKFAQALDLVIGLNDDIQAERSSLPSVSQIRSIQQILDQPGPEEGRLAAARNHLGRQMEKTTKVWADWEDSHDVVAKLLKDFDCETASRSLEVLADLARLNEMGVES